MKSAIESSLAEDFVYKQQGLLTQDQLSARNAERNLARRTLFLENKKLTKEVWREEGINWITFASFDEEALKKKYEEWQVEDELDKRWEGINNYGYYEARLHR